GFRVGRAERRAPQRSHPGARPSLGERAPGRARFCARIKDVGAELAVVVTVAAIFLVPAALGREESDSSFWPRGEMGNALDGALMLALVVMAAWVGALLYDAL